MYKNKLFLLFLTATLITQLAIAQNNTNSPYTRFGYGELSDANSGEQRAMGGVSIGSRSKQSINSVNPASYSSIDSMTFMFDMGGSALRSQFKDNTGSATTTNANLEYLNLQFPVGKRIGVSAGLLPYSFSGYNISSNDTATIFSNTSTPDSIAYSKNFSGTGGISQVYTGISINVLKHLSLGVNAYYMFGKLNNYRNISFLSTSGFSSTTQSNILTANSFRFRYGLQYYNTFAKKHDVSIGLIYEQKNKFNCNYNQITTSVLTDTINGSTDFELPRAYGIGLNYTYNKKITIGLDYSLQEWKNAKYFGKTDSLNNRSKIALGLEYTPNYMSRKLSDRIKYRAGFNITDSYYKINGIDSPQNFGISFGVGLPLRNSNTMLNTTFEYGKIGSTSSLKEDYFKFTLNAVFSEHWFFKRKL